MIYLVETEKDNKVTVVEMTSSIRRACTVKRKLEKKKKVCYILRVPEAENL